MNVKFPGKTLNLALQSTKILNPSLSGPPPGFENFINGPPKPKLSGFVSNNQFSFVQNRGKSPETRRLEPPVSKRRPNTKLSHQNISDPLVPGLNNKSDFYLYKDLTKERFHSDSLSDENDQDLIKEEENDDSEEEKFSNNSQNRKLLKKLSSENIGKFLKQLHIHKNLFIFKLL